MLPTEGYIFSIATAFAGSGLEQESHGELKTCAQAGTEGRCRDGNATAILCTKTCGGCFAAAGAQPDGCGVGAGA